MNPRAMCLGKIHTDIIPLLRLIGHSKNLIRILCCHHKPVFLRPVLHPGYIPVPEVRQNITDPAAVVKPVQIRTATDRHKPRNYTKNHT